MQFHNWKSQDAWQLAAEYPLGMAYIATGDRAKALQNLESYVKRAPNDQNVNKIIEAIRNGKIETKRLSPEIK